jgi:ABC-2 type transport system ATP-binding protein
MSAILSVANGTKKFGRKQVLTDVNFDLPTGRIVGLLGPNGAGKTTILNAIINVSKLDYGKIQVCGEPNGYESKRLISYLPDTNHLFEWMSVRDALHYYADMFPDFDTVRAQELCTLLEIDEKAKTRNLSKGELERILIMLTFSRKVRLYLLDEPLGGIDPLSRKKIIKTIFSQLDSESTILISTHLVKDVETLLDDVLFLNNGKVIFADSADNIREIRGQSIEDCYMEVFENA